MSKFSSVLVVLLAGCGGGLERVSYVTDHLTYAPGGRVEISLTNVSATDLRVNVCLSRLVLENGESAGPGTEACGDLEAEVLKPGDERSVIKTVPATVSGRFRYEATITLPSGAGETVLTPVFTVQN